MGSHYFFACTRATQLKMSRHGVQAELNYLSTLSLVYKNRVNVALLHLLYNKDQSHFSRYIYHIY